MELDQTLEQIKISSLHAIIISVPVINLSPYEAENVMNKAKDTFREVIPDFVKLIFLPSRDKIDYSFIFINK